MQWPISDSTMMVEGEAIALTEQLELLTSVKQRSTMKMYRVRWKNQEQLRVNVTSLTFTTRNEVSTFVFTYQKHAGSSVCDDHHHYTSLVPTDWRRVKQEGRNAVSGMVIITTAVLPLQVGDNSDQNQSTGSINLVSIYIQLPACFLTIHYKHQQLFVCMMQSSTGVVLSCPIVGFTFWKCTRTKSLVSSTFS